MNEECGQGVHYWGPGPICNCHTSCLYCGENGKYVDARHWGTLCPDTEESVTKCDCGRLPADYACKECKKDNLCPKCASAHSDGYHTYVCKPSIEGRCEKCGDELPPASEEYKNQFYIKPKYHKHHLWSKETGCEEPWMEVCCSCWMKVPMDEDQRKRAIEATKCTMLKYTRNIELPPLP